MISEGEDCRFISGQGGENNEEQNGIMGGLTVRQHAVISLRERFGGAGDSGRQRGTDRVSGEHGGGKFCGSYRCGEENRNSADVKCGGSCLCGSGRDDCHL